MNNIRIDPFFPYIYQILQEGQKSVKSVSHTIFENLSI